MTATRWPPCGSRLRHVCAPWSREFRASRCAARSWFAWRGITRASTSRLSVRIVARHREAGRAAWTWLGTVRRGSCTNMPRTMDPALLVPAGETSIESNSVCTAKPNLTVPRLHIGKTIDERGDLLVVQMVDRPEPERSITGQRHRAQSPVTSLKRTMYRLVSRTLRSRYLVSDGRWIPQRSASTRSPLHPMRSCSRLTADPQRSPERRS